MLPVTDTGGVFARWMSWPAIFSGTFVALALELLFVTFGLFIGFTLSSPGGISAWTEAWYFVTAFFALLGGGYVAARGARGVEGGGPLHGLVTWGLTTVATFAFVMWAFYGAANTSMHAVVLATNVPVTQGEASRAATPPDGSTGAIAGDASTLSLVLFGGILCGLVASVIGGAGATKRLPMRRTVVEERI